MSARRRRPAPLVDRVRMNLAFGQSEAMLASSDLEAAARRESELIVDSGALSELSQELSAEILGAGPLEELLELPGVTDVLVNSATEVFVDRGHGLRRASVSFSSDAAVRTLATRLAAQAGRRLDDAAPFVDAALPDGTRLHAILPPLVAHPMISLRVLRRRRLALTDLIDAGMLTTDLANLLRAVVDARLTMLISGGTGTGKTTLLAALLGCVSQYERIVTIEDAAELAVDHPHVVGLFARPANIEGAGRVSLADLVRQALRMRVDRLVIGEFRGVEVLELLAALNTGHTGGAATVHANSAADVPSRLVALAALGGMPSAVLDAQAASALDVLVHVSRGRGGQRFVDQVALWPNLGRGSEPEPAWNRSAGTLAGARKLAARITAADVPLPALLGDFR